jgi:hypothetical protein
VVDQDSPYNTRFGVEGFPTLKIVSPDGAVLGEPKGREVEEIVQALTDARKTLAAFKADLKTADMNRPAVRAAFVPRYLAQGDLDSARNLVLAFDPNDPSPEHFTAVQALANFLLAVGKADQVPALLDPSERVFKTDDEIKAMKDLRAGLLVAALDKAYQAKDKDLCLKILDELCLKYPDYHDMAQHKDVIRRQLQESLEK